MKLIKSILIVICILNIIIAETTQFGKKFKKLRHLKKNTDNQDNDISAITEQIKNIVASDQKANPEDVPDIPIYLEGWVKYIHYRDNTTGEKPRSFFKNEGFFKQKKTADDLKKKDKKGYINIPTDKSFWFAVLKDTVNIITSRKNNIYKTYDALNIDFIKPIPETKKFSGGVKDFGSFNEGHCFQVVTIVPSKLYQMSTTSAAPETGAQEIWILCLETMEEKEKFMSTLIKLKLKKQHDLGHYLETQDVVKRQKELEDSNKQVDPTQQQVTASEDGYWVTIQDWTQCTLKCGGGLQYQQNACVPPKNGGKPCQGPAIRTRPCNTQPCPTVKTASIVANPLTRKPDALHLKPVVKAMRVSTKPLRYDKCHLKESDAMMSRVSKEAEEQGFTDVIEQYPVRIVMNNKTIMLYTDDSYSATKNTFVLADTRFVRIQGKENCFKLVSNNREAELCEIEGQKGKFVEEWDYDFNLFKIQCKTHRPEIQLDSTEEKKLEEHYKEKVAEAKMDIVRDRQAALKKAVENKDEILLEKKVQVTQTTSIQALRKELQLEERLESEEKEREDVETKEIAQQIEIEKKKNECLVKVLKQKEIEDQFNLAKEETEQQIANIKKEAKKEIEIKRNEMKSKILAMRRKNERKKNLLKQQLMSVRTEMASNLQNATKKGSKAVCEAAKGDQTKINAYCENNFYDNFNRMADCKDPTSFCYVCCENEYGDIFVSERGICYNMCDKKPENLKTPGDEGRWQWEPEVNSN